MGRGVAACVCAALVAAGLAISGPSAASADTPYVDAALTETPSSVAVSDNGIIVAGLFDARAVAIVDASGAMRTVSIDCSPNDVAISPTGKTAWAVCQGSEHIMVVDVAAGSVTVVSVDKTGLDDVVYLPQVDQLMVASIEGELIRVSQVSTGGYFVLNRVVMPQWRITELAPYGDGSATYAVTDAGDLIFIDIDFGGQVVPLRPRTPDRLFISVAMSPTQTALYASVVDNSDPAAPSTSLEVVSPATGLAMQSVPLDLGSAYASTVALAAGHRSVSVGSGVPVPMDGTTSGLVSVPVDDQGRLGSPEALVSGGIAASSVGLSADGSRVAFGTTNSTAVGLRIEGAPYPRAIRATAKARGTSLTVIGSTTSMTPLTRLSVYVRDLTKPKSRFIKQAKSAIVSSTGGFTWKGTMPSRRAAVYLSTGGTRSATVTVTSTRAAETFPSAASRVRR